MLEKINGRLSSSWKNLFALSASQADAKGHYACVFVALHKHTHKHACCPHYLLSQLGPELVLLIISMSTFIVKTCDYVPLFLPCRYVIHFQQHCTALRAK